MKEIKTVVSSGELVVAFSGGEDSSLVALLAKQALGSERVVLAHIDWGMYEYEITREIVKEFAHKTGLRLHIIDGSGTQKRAWRYGPSCNSCTKFVKLPLLRMFAGNRIVATGANLYDSWGKTGIKMHEGFYAPLSNVTKEEIRGMICELGIEIEKVGESMEREGCKLKHLLKMLVNEEYHGRAVAEANEILLAFLNEVCLKPSQAAVKIIGPLRKNIAAVNVFPPLEYECSLKLKERLMSLPAISDVVFPDENSEVVVVTSKPIYRSEEARRNIEKVIGLPGKYVWIESKNTTLRTYQVVEVRI